MNRTKTPLIILGSSYLVLLVALALTYHSLPERVASHFNAAGVPDAWMSRSSHVCFIGGLAFGISVFLVGLFYCTRFFPVSTINLPHREYWLVSDRRAETFDFIFRAGVWFACFEVFFMLGVHLLVVAANRSQPARLSSGIWLLGGVFAGIVFLWIYALIRRFNNVRQLEPPALS